MLSEDDIKEISVLIQSKLNLYDLDKTLEKKRKEIEWESTIGTYIITIGIVVTAFIIGMIIGKVI